MEEQGNVHFTVSADDKQFNATLKNVNTQVRNTTQQIEKSGASIDGFIGKFTKGFVAMGAAFSAQQFAQKIMQVRGQFQQLEVAFETMLGSAEKANVLMSQLVRTAAITPFGLTDIAQGAKQLLAYGTASEKVNETLIRLGDIAAGLSIPLNDLVYLYGTTQTQGRLYTQDMRQFMGRGIPLAEELAKQFGVTKDKVGELVTAGKVGFPEVEKAIISMTSEGGKFGGLMEKQSHTITGQISNIEDALDMMFNDLGKQSEGAINTALQGVSWLVENYKQVGEAILTLVGIYGSYKAAIIVTAAVEKLRYQATLAQMAGYTKMGAITEILKAKTAALNKTLLANPYALVLASVVALSYAIYKLSTRTTEAQEVAEKAKATEGEVIVEQQKEIAKLEELDKKLKKNKKGTKEWKEAKDTAISQYSQYLPKLDQEIEKTGNLSSSYKTLADNIRKAVAARKVETLQNTLIDEQSKKQTKAIEELGKKLKDNGMSATNIAKWQTWAAEYMLGGGSNKTNKKNITWLRDYLKNDWEVRDSYRLDDGSIIVIGDDEVQAIQELHEANAQTTKSIEELEKKFGAEAKNDNKGKAEDAKNQEKNKKYWEDRKKNLEEELSLLEDNKKNETKRKKLLSEIAAAQKHIDWYSTKNSGRNSGKSDAVKAAERNAEQLQALELANQEAQTDLLEEGKKKRLAQIQDEYDKRIAEIDKLTKEFKQNNKTAKTAVGSDGLTDDQRTQLNKSREFAAKKATEQRNEEARAELEAMRTYLTQYGTFQQQKLSIAEEYAEKIRKAQSEGERLSLTKERENALAQVGYNELAADIDWGRIMGDFGSMFEEELEPTLKKLEAYTKTDAFKNTDEQSKQTIYGYISQLRQETAGGWSGMFKNLGDATKRYEMSSKALAIAKDKEKEAAKKLTEAKEAEKNATTDLEKELAGKEVVKAQKAFEQAANSVNVLTTSNENAQNELSDAANRVRTNLNNLADGLQALSSNSLSGIFGGAKSIAKLFGEKDLGGSIGKAISEPMSKVFSKAVGDALAGPIGGEIIEGVFAILDILANGVENLVANLIEVVTNAVNGILKTVLNPVNNAKVIGNALRSGLQNIANTITFGGFKSWFDGNARQYAETRQIITERIDNATKELEAIKGELKRTSGVKAVELSRKAVEAQEKLNEARAEQLRNDMRYHGSHHSNASNWTRDDFTNVEAAYLTELFGGWDWATISKNLTPEKMAQVRSENYALWQKMSNIGDYEERFDEDWEALADEAGKITELYDQLNESLTQVSFDSLYDNWEDTLMDMSADWSTFADSLPERLMRAMLSAQLEEKLKPQLEKWYGAWADAMIDGVLDDAERQRLYKTGGTYYNKKTGKTENYLSYDEITRLGIDIRDAVANATGYTGDSGTQSGSTGAFQGMSQDVGNELNGRFTALQISGESINLQVGVVAQNTTMLCNLNTIRNKMLSDLLTQNALMAADIADLKKYAKVLPDTNSSVNEIYTKVKNL